jgi:hypothetical protein
MDDESMKYKREQKVSKNQFHCPVVTTVFYSVLRSEVLETKQGERNTMQQNLSRR